MNYPALYHMTKEAALLVPVARTALVTGTGVAVPQGGWGEAVAILQVGVIGATTLNVKIQHSTALTAASTAWVDLTDKTGAVVAFTAVSATGDNTIQSIPVPMNGVKKYIRVVGTPTTTAISYLACASILVGGEQDLVDGGVTF